ncbi:PAS domain S-box protein [Candidatus Sumerlaeota bacterium]|nr:PAS domain S-box protein [Candidatus Sumerlaeota bacterium]
MNKSTFAGKFIAKLEKIDREQIESYLKRLWQERSFLEQVFQTLAEGIIVTDMESRIVFINRGAYKLLGISQRQRLLGEPLIEVIRDSNLLQGVQEFSLPSDGQVESYELKVQYPRPATYLVKIVPLREEETSELSSLVFIISDISEAKRKEEERSRQERLDSLATLTAGIAHEIKNPLNALNIHAQLLKRSIEDNSLIPDTPEYQRAKQSLEIIIEEIRRLARIVNQFITAVRPFKLHLKSCDVNRILEELVKTFGPELKERRIKITMSLERDIPPIYADEHLIRQTFLNILKNAIETIEDQNGEIGIRTFYSGKWVYVSVRDNGKGMTEEEMRRMFEPYFTTKDYGSGLGLFIVYRVIQEHRGEIKVQSEKGKGTVFTVQLPILKRPVRLLPHKKRKAKNEKKNSHS